jgi:glycosyltransferase involved in cell wall biosynthesis
MRIGFDAKRAFMNSSGLGNYSRTLIYSLLVNFPEHEYVAFTPGIRKNLGKELTASGKLRLVHPPELIRNYFSSWWRTSMMSKDIRSQKLNIYHGLSNELPKGIPSSIKKIVTIHDLIFLRHPEWFPFIDRNIYYYKFRFACKNADAIVAVSEQTKKDIIHFFRTDPEKIKVIYQSCDEKFYQRREENALSEFRKQKKLPEKFILNVGTIEERKNLLTLVRAMANVKDVSLVVIGTKKKYFEKVQEYIGANHLQSRVIFPEDIKDDDLPLYYQSASCFVYPSYYEGFGIPVIEALWSGTPVITSANSALSEAGGTSSLYINADDDKDLAEKINSVLSEENLREKMIRDGLEYVQRFYSKKTSAEMMDLYQSLLKL